MYFENDIDYFKTEYIGDSIDTETKTIDSIDVHIDFTAALPDAALTH